MVCVTFCVSPHLYSHFLEQACVVLADVGEARDDIVEVEVTECGVVLALSTHLVQQQVPAIYRRQQVLVLPVANTTHHILDWEEMLKHWPGSNPLKRLKFCSNPTDTCSTLFVEKDNQHRLRK